MPIDFRLVSVHTHSENGGASSKPPKPPLLDSYELSVCIRMIEGGEGDRQSLCDAFRKALSDKEALLSRLDSTEREGEEVISWKQRYYEKY